MINRVNYLIPTVVENTNKGNYLFDIYSKLLRERIIFITGEICDENANIIISQLIYLESINPYSDITIYINSYGGSISAGMAIYDAMNYILPNICTLCIGIAYSMAAFLLSSGYKGKRFALPNSRIMIHQPIGGVYGQAVDMLIHTKEIIEVKNNINRILSLNTGKNLFDIEKDTDRDNFMSSIDALQYGIIDKVYLNKKNLFFKKNYFYNF